MSGSLLSLLALAACGASATPGGSGGASASAKPVGPPPAPVTTARAQTGPIQAGLSFTGDVTASQQVNLAPKVSGIVIKLSADVGTQVKAGQQIAELDHATQDAAVIQAQAGVEVAQSKLSQEQAQGRPEDVAKANAALAQQQAKLNSMVKQGRPETVGQAQANLDTANAKLQALQNGSKPQDIAAAQATVDAAKNKLQALQNGPRPEQVVVYQRAIDVAKNNLYSAQLTRDALCAGVSSGQTATAGRPANCASGQASVNAAQTALDQANQQYQLNVAPPVSTDVAQAEDALKSAQDALDKLQNPNTPQDIQQAQASVSAAQNALNLAKNPNTSDDIAGQQAAVAQAQQAAQEAATPFVATDFQAAQANLDSAQANLQAAQVNVDLTKVTAPFDGVISAKLLTEGALASPTVPIFTIVSNNVEVDLPVAQEQLPQIKEGQPAQLTTPSVSGQIDGKIAAISPAADPKSRTFLVKVVPSNQDGKLKPGMSAGVVIQTQAIPDALLIPKDAITTDPNTNAQGVYVVQSGPNGDTAVFKTVSIGATDDKNVQILSGLNPGDQVVVSGQSSLTNNQRVRSADSSAQGSARASGAASGAASGRPQGSGSAQASASGAPAASGASRASSSPSASASAGS
ncbi:MAG: efflux RND transporter periplasmic adaptor subunit [Chloroflexi bacterium]|nr:efflux RND transporter periplasmic adaptor subunit [Chloroflexota bacterium]